MTPRLSISECTTFPATFDRDVADYSSAGVQGIGIWEFKLPPDRDEESIASMRGAGLRASICVPAVPCIYPDAFFTTPSSPAERTGALETALRRFKAFDPDVVMVTTGDPTGQDVAEMRRVTVQGLRRAADVAADLDLTIGVEAYRASSGSLVTGIQGMVDLADEIDRRNVGIIVDTWHVCDDPGVLDDVRKHVSRIVGVQICDYREPTRSWADRVMPGDGVIDWAGWFRTLDEAGYKGWYDLEIFSDDGRFGNAWPDSIWARPGRQVAEVGMAGLARLWANRNAGAPGAAAG